LLIPCNSKDYLQKAKRGEGVQFGETLARNNNGQMGTTIARGPKNTLEKQRLAMGGEQQWGSSHGQGTTMGKE
jgi:hypothetical protein